MLITSANAKNKLRNEKQKLPGNFSYLFCGKAALGCLHKKVNSIPAFYQFYQMELPNTVRSIMVYCRNMSLYPFTKGKNHMCL